MTTERAVRAMAGTIVLVSLLLAYTVSRNWLWLTTFVGFNLFQSAFTGICPAEYVFRKLGLKSSGSCCTK